VDWGGLPVEDVYPKQAPDVFSAGPVILKGRYTRAAEGDITIRGLVRGRPWSRTVHVKLPALDGDGSAISTLWAREKLEDLQNQDWLGAQTGSPNPALKEQIVNTALEYRLMSQYTSFVAVEERVLNAGGKQRTVDVPVEMPDGVSYEGIFGESEAKKSAMGMASAARYRGQAQSYYFGAAAPLSRTAPAMAGKPAASLAAAAPALRQLSEAQHESLLDTNALLGDKLRDGEAGALKQLAALKPEERVKVLRAAKLSADLRTKVESVEKARKGGLTTIKDVVEVQIWLNKLPPDGLTKLKALGFDLSATLLPNKLALGTVDTAKLDALIELAFVRKIETPKVH
jgi:Ca-activated chloride channel family protein